MLWSDIKKKKKPVTGNIWSEVENNFRWKIDKNEFEQSKNPKDFLLERESNETTIKKMYLHEYNG